MGGFEDVFLLGIRKCFVEEGKAAGCGVVLPVGSDCSALGSSRLARPSISGLESGLGIFTQENQKNPKK